ncbi:ERMES complex subunit [Komagataella kurtzmanii]|nr:ERMES complex subunit [Komagataella kurtzmanii]
MSFNINWDSIQKESLSAWTAELLNDALNSGKRPNVLCTDIQIEDLSFGTIPPDFEILEIGDLSSDSFRGIFKFNYDGDASITLRTKVQANPLKIYEDNLLDQFEDDQRELGEFIKPRFVMATDILEIPLNLKLSQIKLSSIIIIVFSRSKGLTLVFKNDPLESISVSSTFDRIKPLARFLQNKIETQISELFKEFLPSVLYKFSQKYTTENFADFHRELLHTQHPERNTENRVTLQDIDPEAPLMISPGSLMRLTTLSSSRQTLTLGGKISADKLNPDIITKNYFNELIPKTYNKFQLKADKVADIAQNIHSIKNLQSRIFWKNSKNNDKPHRRVVCLGDKSKEKRKQIESESLYRRSVYSQGSIFNDGASDVSTLTESTEVEQEAPNTEFPKLQAVDLKPDMSVETIIQNSSQEKHRKVKPIDDIGLIGRRKERLRELLKYDVVDFSMPPMPGSPTKFFNTNIFHDSNHINNGNLPIRVAPPPYQC